MVQAIERIDVFLSYGIRDAGIAGQVRQALTESGITAISHADVPAGARASEAIRRALVQCDAMVVILPSEGSMPASIGIEIGAAMAWQKPLYFIHAGIAAIEMPFDISEWPVYPATRIEDVIHRIRQGVEPLSPRDTKVLMQVYLEFGTPLDRILLDASLQQDFVSKFQDRSSSSVSGERLFYEAIRLRKAGGLPRLRGSKTSVK